MNNTTTLGQSIVRNTVTATSLRREQEDAKLAKLSSYSKYDGRITRVYVRQGGYAGGILRTDRDAQGNRITRRFSAKTFTADGSVAQVSQPFSSRRAAMLWLANVNGL